MKKSLEILGIILFIIGLFLIIKSQSMETTVDVENLNVNNIGLITDKLNNLILGGILTISGLILVLNEDKQKVL